MKRLLYTGIARNLRQKSEIFLKYGYYMIELPLIEIEAVVSDFSVASKTEWLFLTSQAPLEILPDDYLQSKRIAVIGQQTGNALVERGLKAELIAEKPTKESLLATFTEKIHQASIFYPKSDLTDNYLETELLKKGYQVSSKIIYRNQLPNYSEKSLVALIFYKDIRTIFLAVHQHGTDFAQLSKKEALV